MPANNEVNNCLEESRRSIYARGLIVIIMWPVNALFVEGKVRSDECRSGTR